MICDYTLTIDAPCAPIVSVEWALLDSGGTVETVTGGPNGFVNGTHFSGTFSNITLNTLALSGTLTVQMILTDADGKTCVKTDNIDV